MIIPQPFRAIVWIITAIGLGLLIYGIMSNSIAMIVGGGIAFVIFLTVGMLWGIPDIE